MKYAIINIDNALKAGIRKEYHIMNQSKSMLIVNENELAKFGDPSQQAIRLGGKLIGRKELNEILNSKEWQQNK
jgi:hypothetical protein